MKKIKKVSLHFLERCKEEFDRAIAFNERQRELNKLSKKSQAS